MKCPQGHQHVLWNLASLREHRWLAWQAEEAAAPPFCSGAAALQQPSGSSRCLEGQGRATAGPCLSAGWEEAAPETILLDQVSAGSLSFRRVTQVHAMLREQHPARIRKAACRKQWLQVSLLALDSGVAAAAAEAGCLDIVYWVARRLKQRFDPFPSLCAAIAGRHPRLAIFVARKWRTRLSQQELSRCWTMARRAGQGQVGDAMLCLLLSCLDRPAVSLTPTAGPSLLPDDGNDLQLVWPRAPPPSPSRME